MKKALITGITGQDGSYITEILLEKGYEVHGIIRRSSSFNTGRIDHLYENSEVLDKKLFLHYGDLVDTSNLNRLLEKIQPVVIFFKWNSMDIIPFSFTGLCLENYFIKITTRSKIIYWIIIAIVLSGIAILPFVYVDVSVQARGYFQSEIEKQVVFTPFQGA